MNTNIKSVIEKVCDDAFKTFKDYFFNDLLMSAYTGILHIKYKFKRSIHFVCASPRR